MKVIVIGATGQVGRLAVRHLLDKGHHVTGFARKPDKLKIADPALTLVAGDAMNSQDVQSAIEGHDAVVVTLGSGKSLRSDIRS